MGKYAKQTEVSVEKSRQEIEQILRIYGADGFAYAYFGDTAKIEFLANDRQIRFALNLPDQKERRFTHTEGRDLQRTREAAIRCWEQECRSLWRSLLLSIKAKLEAIDCGISVFDQEFLANIVDPVTNKTVGETIVPQLEISYSGSGKAVNLLGWKYESTTND